jgi:hypothetical protein
MDDKKTIRLLLGIILGLAAVAAYQLGRLSLRPKIFVRFDEGQKFPCGHEVPNPSRPPGAPPVVT